MSITRRIFLRNGAPGRGRHHRATRLSHTRSIRRCRSGTRTKRLVVIFQRGAADGLNIVVPHGEAAYYAMRPTINIPKKSVLDLDGFFGLHPAMASFEPLWRQRHLAIVHAAGSPDPRVRISMRRTSWIGHARHQSDRRWLAEPRAARASGHEIVLSGEWKFCRLRHRSVGLPRDCTRALASTNSLWQRTGHCAQQSE